MRSVYKSTYIKVNKAACLSLEQQPCTVQLMKYGERLKLAREAAKLTQAGLVAKIGSGITQAGISYLEKGDATGSEFTVQFATACAVRPEWLAEEKGVMRENSHHIKKAEELRVQQMDSPYSNVTPAPNIRGFVPLISWVQAGEYCEAIDHADPDDDVELVPITVPKLRHTFALAVVGDSMSPEFPEGMRLVVEPDLQYQAGDYVIAKNGGEATFKQLVKDSGEWYLKPLNPQYPTKALGEANIIGVVREAVRKFR